MKTRKTPMRMCLGCREMFPKKDLIRIVHTPDGEVLADPTGKKPGRGAYICNRAECLHKAIKSKQIERAFACQVSDEIREGLEKCIAEGQSGS